MSDDEDEQQQLHVYTYIIWGKQGNRGGRGDGGETSSDENDQQLRASKY